MECVCVFAFALSLFSYSFTFISRRPIFPKSRAHAYQSNALRSECENRKWNRISSMWHNTSHRQQNTRRTIDLARIVRSAVELCFFHNYLHHFITPVCCSWMVLVLSRNVKQQSNDYQWKKSAQRLCKVRVIVLILKSVSPLMAVVWMVSAVHNIDFRFFVCLLNPSHLTNYHCVPMRFALLGDCCCYSYSFM